jgi:hypothetical protein
LYLSDMDMDCNQIALPEKDRRYTLLCSFGIYASYHSTWHYSKLGLVGKIFVICKIFFDARTCYWQLHNCQLGPFDGLALGINLTSTRQSINGWEVDRKYFFIGFEFTSERQWLTQFLFFLT